MTWDEYVSSISEDGRKGISKSNEIRIVLTQKRKVHVDEGEREYTLGCRAVRALTNAQHTRMVSALPSGSLYHILFNLLFCQAA
jgi:hypothetical protein